MAQTSNYVLLQTPDKSNALSGELLEAANGQYKLSTVAGILAIDVNGVICTGDTCAPVVPIFEAGAQVNLTSTDGAVKSNGSILDIVEGHYVVNNAELGSLRISTEVVECTGPGCPTGQRFANEANVVAAAPTIKAKAETPKKAETEQSDPANARVSFVGSNTVGFGLLPHLLEDYADYLNASVVDTKVMSETETFVRYTGPEAPITVLSRDSGSSTRGVFENAVFDGKEHPSWRSE